MSEKEIIENAKDFISIDILYGGRIVLLKSQLKFYQNTIQELLDLYNNLKEIEQLHQEENGKLRVELEKKEQIIKRLEQDVEGYRDLSKQIQEDYSKQIRDYEEGYNE
jgi:chromosome segregation ATPase